MAKKVLIDVTVTDDDFHAALKLREKIRALIDGMDGATHDAALLAFFLSIEAFPDNLNLRMEDVPHG